MATSLEELKKRISRPETQLQHYKILIYGPSGVGKTTLYDGAQNTLVLDVEHGTSVLSKNSKVDVLQLKGWEDLQGIFLALQSGDLAPTNIVLDSITDIRELCKDNVLETQSRKRVSEDTPSQQDWGVITERMRKMIRNFRALPINSVFIAREYTNKDEDTGAERVRPAIGGKLEDDLPGMMDVTAYMTIGDEGKRFIGFDLTGKYYAKDRTHQFPRVLENPTWADFEKALPELKPPKQQKAKQTA